MKSRDLSMLACLLIGILGASGSTAAAGIDNTISGANIDRIADATDFRQRAILDGLADRDAIARAIYANYINCSTIEEPTISDISLIAIENSIDANIQEDQIEAEINEIAITEIAA